MRLALYLLLVILLLPLSSAFASNFVIRSSPAPIDIVWHPGYGRYYWKLPDGQVGRTYTVTFDTNSTYAHTLEWFIEGTVPPGLGVFPINRRGATLRLTGTPNRDGTFYFKVTAGENYPNGPQTRSEFYTITISPSPTPPPPPTPIDYNMRILEGARELTTLHIDYDLTPVASGIDTGVAKTGYQLVLRKLSGENEMISLRQEGLPTGVDMWVETTLVRSPTRLILENLFLSDVIRLHLWFSVGAGWRELAGPGGEARSYRVAITARSTSGVERSVYISLRFYYTLPLLRILSLEPVTQQRSLIQSRQAIFKFNYTLSSPTPLRVDVRLLLSPPRHWSYYTLSRDWSYRTTFDQPALPHRVDRVSGQDRILIEDRVVLEPTPDGRARTAYLFESYEGRRGVWFPEPTSTEDVEVGIEVDPYRRVRFDDRSSLAIFGRFPVKRHGGEERIKIIILDLRRFTSEQQNILRHSDLPHAYGVYLSGIFPADFLSSPLYEGWGWDIGWWDADTLAEEAADEGYCRVVVIVRPGSLGGGRIGVVYNAGYYWFDDGFHTAWLDYNWAIDPQNNLYFPVLAHEISHTMRFGDIYGRDRQIVVDFDYVYFDEVQGGIIGIFKTNITISVDANPSMVISGPSRRRVPLPTNISAWDIMDYARHNERWMYWAYASYRQVASYIGGTADPPEGLLVSIVLFRNGSALGRPFQKIYNHSFRYPRTDAVGNFSLMLYDRGGNVFRRYPCNVSFYYFAEPEGYVASDVTSVRTIVEWSDDIGRIELVDSKGKVWFKRIVSAHVPVLEVIYPPEGKKLGIGRNYTIAWKCTDADGDELWYTVLIRKVGEDVWRSIASRIRRDRISLVPSEMLDDRVIFKDHFEEGDYQVQIKATDGVNTAVKVVRVSIAREVKMYSLSIDSNIGLKILGSGLYEEGDIIEVKAPIEEPMKGLLGLLGGRHLFICWKGAVESKDPRLVVHMIGEETQLKLTAFYDPDYSQVWIRSGGLILVSAIILVIAFRLRRKPQPTLPPPPPPT